MNTPPENSAVSPSSDITQQKIGTVAALQGSLVRLSNEDSQVLNTGDPIYLHDELRTIDGTPIQIAFWDQNSVYQLPNVWQSDISLNPDVIATVELSVATAELSIQQGPEKPLVAQVDMDALLQNIFDNTEPTVAGSAITGVNSNGIASLVLIQADYLRGFIDSGFDTNAQERIEIIAVSDEQLEIKELPVAISGDDLGSVTEDVVLSVSGLLNADDLSAEPDFFQATNGVIGNFGRLDLNTDGVWTYTLNNNDTNVQALSDGDSVTDTLTVTSINDITHDIVITIHGTNDLPEITGHDNGEVIEDTVLSTSGTLLISDIDNGESLFQAESNIVGDYGNLSIDTNGAWTYTLTNSDSTVQALGDGDSLSDTISVSSTDGTAHDVVITIHGTDDAPVLSGDDSGEVTEDTVLTTSGTLLINDADSGESIFQAESSIAGDYGNLSIDVNGAWTYTLTNSDSAVQALGDGDSLSDTISVSSTDGTAHDVVITIHGTDDAPVLSGDDSGEVIEDTVLMTSGTLLIDDVDNGESLFQAESNIAGDYGNLSIDVNGAWTYTLTNSDSAVQALGDGDSLSDTISVSSTDGTAHDVVITIHGTDDAPVLSGDDSGEVIEDTVLTTSGTLLINDADSGESIFQAESSITGDYGSLSIDVNGNWVYILTNEDNAVQALGDGDSLTDTLTVSSVDGTSHDVVITIYGTDDVPVLSGDDSGEVIEDTVLSTSGTLLTDDADNGESLFQAESNIAGDYGNLSIDVNGAWSYTLTNSDSTVQALGDGDSLTDTLTVSSIDGTAHDVVITIHGTDDAPVLSGDDNGEVIEDTVLSTSGTLLIDDADNGESLFQAESNIAGDYGNLSIDTNGAWTYTLINSDSTVQALGDGDSLTDTLTVSSVDGTAHDVVITIHGTDDVPVLSGDDSGEVTEDTVLTTSGTLLINDADSGESIFQAESSIAGDYGNLSIDVNGAWTYTLTNSDSTVQALGDGDSLTDTLTVSSIDGTAHDVVIAIHGTDDAPVLSGDDSGEVIEDTVLSTSGTLLIDDADSGESIFQAESSIAGDYGNLSIDVNGAWTYTLTNSDSTVQALGDGDSLTDTLTVSSIDGTAHDVVITIHGTDDVPVLSGDDSGEVTEDTVLTTSGTLLINDADSGESIFQAESSIAGDYGNLSIDTNGAWTYTLINSDSTVQALGDGDSLTDTLTVSSVDGTAHDVVITIHGINDISIIAGNDSGTVSEDNVLTTSGILTISDTDTNESIFQTQSNVNGSYGSFTVDENGNWQYTLDNDSTEVQALNDNESLIETFTVTSGDGANSHNVVINIDGADDINTVIDANPDVQTVNADFLHADGTTIYYIRPAGSTSKISEYGTLDVNSGNATPINQIDISEIGGSPDIAQSPDGKLYIIGYDGVIAELDPKTNTIDVLPGKAGREDDSAGISGYGLAVGVDGTIYVDGSADMNNKGGRETDGMFAVDPETGDVTHIAESPSWDNTDWYASGDVVYYQGQLYGVYYPENGSDQVTIWRLDLSQVDANNPSTDAYTLILDIDLPDGTDFFSIAVDEDGVLVLPATDGNIYEITDLSGDNPSDETILQIKSTDVVKTFGIAEAPDYYDLLEQPPVNGNVLNNDTTSANATLSVVAVDGQRDQVGVGIIGQYGELTLNSDGSYQYNFIETAALQSTLDQAVFDNNVVTITEEFTYTISNGDITDTTTLTINLAIDGTGAPLYSVTNWQLNLIDGDAALGHEDRVDANGADTLTLSVEDIQELGHHTGVLIVKGDTDDALILSNGSWTDNGIQFVDSDFDGVADSSYHVYTEADGVTKVYLDTNITSVTMHVAPIVLDLDGDGVEYNQAGVLFDTDFDGQAELTAWAGEDDGLLVYDKNADGDITETDEIAFTRYKEGAETDLEGLQAFDSNANGFLDSNDELWSAFSIWQDRNQDAQVNQGELIKMDDAGITYINLSSDGKQQDIGSVHEYGQATYGLADGSEGILADAAFESQEVSDEIDNTETLETTALLDGMDSKTVGELLAPLAESDNLNMSDADIMAALKEADTHSITESDFVIQGVSLPANDLLDNAELALQAQSNLDQ